MKHKRRIKGTILGIFTGIFCFVLLAVLLYGTQIFVSYQQQYDNAVAELTQIRDQMAAQQVQDDLVQMADDLIRVNVQKAALVLSNTEITAEKLAAVAEYEPSITAMMVFREDGTLLHSFGEAKTDPEFLRVLQKGQIEKTENDMSFLAMRLEGDTYLAVGADNFSLEEGYQQTQYDMVIVAELANGMSGNVAVVNRANERVLYGPDAMLGRKLSNLLLFPPETFFNGTTLVLAMGHSLMLAATLEYGNYQLLSLFDVFNVIQGLHAVIVPALLGFGFLIFLLLAYTKFIRTDMCRGRLGKIHYVQFGKKHYLNTLLLRKLVGFAMIGIACMVCVVYCLQLLVRSDEQRQNAEYRLDIAARILEENQSIMADAEQLDMTLLTLRAQEAQSMLKLNPKLLNEDGLNSMARLLNADGICVLDDDGKLVAATTSLQNYALSGNAADANYAFWNVIHGFAESHVQNVPKDPYNHEMDTVYAGVANEDDHGMLLLALNYDAFRTWQMAYDVDTRLETIGIDSQSILLAVKSGSDTCVFDSSNQYTGLSLAEYGIDESFLRNGYSGTHQFDGEDCLITTRSLLNWHLLYLTPTGLISASSWIFTILVIVAGLMVVMITVVPWLVVRTPGEDIRKPANKAHSVRQRSHVDAILDRDGQIELVESRIEQHTMRKRWQDKNANAKLNSLVRGLMATLGGGLLIFLFFGRHTGNYPLLDRILNQNWDKTVNVYAVSYVAIVVTGVWVLAEVMQNITEFVTGTFSRRWKTTGILFSNIIRYATLIFSIFFTLKNFGVQTSSLATSASLLTLIFGLGCQNFVADLVAGIFLLFEGAFRVGDIVTIDNWHGEVVEIGLRSTKVKNEIGNVKVFQNSRISGAVNMTRDQTFAVCDIPLPAGEMLEAYEEKLTTSFFPEAMKSIEILRHPLVYEGVVNMNGDNAILRISVKCLEHDREQIKRELYRALKLWREQSAKKPPANA